MAARHAAAALPQSAASVAVDHRLDLEESIAHAQALNGLAQWISAARETLNELRSSARFDPVLDERLGANSVFYNAPEWTSFESDALYRLHTLIEQNLGQIADATINARGSVQ